MESTPTEREAIVDKLFYESDLIVHSLFQREAARCKLRPDDEPDDATTRLIEDMQRARYERTNRIIQQAIEENW